MGRLTKTDYFILILICLLTVYVVLRTVLVNITHDEAYSFYIMKNFWYAEALCTGNTHWLNSLAIKTAIVFHLEAEWQIRWLSTVSALIFFFITFLWIRSVEFSHSKFLIFSLLLLNPYISAYFVIARGYGPGLMLEALAFVLFLRSLRKDNAPPPLPALICSGLSALANFSFVYFFVAFSLLYFSLFYFKDHKKSWRAFSFYRDLVFVSGILFIIARAFLFMTRCSNDVVGAGTPEFSEFPIVFFHGLLYDPTADPVTLKFLSPTLFLGVLLSCLGGIFRKNAKEDRIYFFSSQVLLIMLVSMGILHVCFGAVLPYYRSAIFLFPTSAVCITCFLNRITDLKFKKIAFYSTSFLLAAHFIFTMNLSSVFDYRDQADLRKSFDLLRSLKATRVGMSPELYGGFKNYYQETKQFSYPFKGEPVNTREPKSETVETKELKNFDYLLISPPYDLDYYSDQNIKLKAIKLFNTSGTLVLRVYGSK